MKKCKMKKCRFGKAVFFMAALSFLMFSRTAPVQASFRADLPEEDQEAFDAFSGDIPDEDIQTFMEDYLEKVERGEITIEDYSAEKIFSPDLRMEATGTGRIRFLLPDGNSYQATVPSGMTTANPVELILPDGAIAVVSRGGDADVRYGSILCSEPGEYRIKLVFLPSGAEASERYLVYELSHDFTILKKTTGNRKRIQAPEGFQFSEIKKDGVRMEIAAPDYLSLDAADSEGRYELRLQDKKTGTISLSTGFQLDMTAPYLTFSKEIEGTSVSGPVEFSPSETGTTIYLTYNGNRAVAQQSELTVPGHYTLEVMDEAGNVRSYQFQIRQTYQFFDIRVVIMALVLLGGLAVRLLFLRKNMTVL